MEPKVSKEFGMKIGKLIEGSNFSREEMKDMFSKVLLNRETEMHQGAFLAALTVKGETVEEIAGSWDAIYELDTVKASPNISQPLVENCGTGMDDVDTFNISTAASMVAATAGVVMAKHGSRAITSNCGTIDILEELGVGVECSPEVIVKSIEQAGIGIFNGMDSQVHPTALGRILSKISFGTTLNIAASLANPVCPQYGVRGVYSKELLKPVAQVMHEIGYKKAIVVHGLAEDGVRGMDEASTLGENYIVEIQEDGKIDEYSFIPEDLNIERVISKEIAPDKDRRKEALKMLSVLKGKEGGAREDIVCLNAALILYLMDYSAQIKDAYLQAKDIVASGEAIEKLKEWVRTQNVNSEQKLAKLNSLLEKI
ncbi:anthranilate phosphoribosyltransferase [Natroniella acetigena]|uniref:anthranilate phosphoribosyltransferase n=1 Tax=Natroniella acetigena TaxID=52004 RepID=UPI002009DDAD|nr:anthranilate phosphoribosyltransferase [Natroniella acetigena]MCK8827152.1 anthranilate phosphoribosyltransferase [Natroniella acetigena]